jgi:phosphoribosyl 1,2-cyclic phosphodiesterase
MSVQSPMSVRFWGVRGSIPAPGPETARYGGNTPCIEVRCGEHMIILDAGSGIRLLGNALMRGKSTIDADIFFSHCHIDHINGLPFFAPAFARGNRLRLWAGNLMPAYRLEEVVRRTISPPLFPVEVEIFKARMEYRDFRAGDVLEPRPGVTVRTAPLDHPDGSTGYRIEYGGLSIAYITDTETRHDDCIRRITSLARGVELMIFDCTYTEAELPSRVGWGHSSWQQGLRLAEAAGAKVFCLFHHDPDRDDRAMDCLAAAADAARAGTIVAREGLVVDLLTLKSAAGAAQRRSPAIMNSPTPR